MRSVPFFISDINHGFQEAKGLLKASDKGIDLEFEVSDSILGMFKSGVKTIQIPYADLESIEFKKGWIGAKIILKTYSMKTLEDIPGAEQAECTFKIKRKDREEAQKLTSRARLQLSEYKLRKLEESDDLH